jgi:biopolymer transport protein ExbB
MSFLKLLRAPLVAATIAFTGTLPLAALAQETAASAPVEASAPTDVAAPAPGSVPTPETKKETIDNPYGLDALWSQGDFVARGTLIIMILMSMGSWYIIFTKLWEQHKMFKSAGSVGEDFWKSGSIKAGAAKLEEGSAFRFVADQGIKAAEHHEGTLVDNIDLHTWIGMSVERAVGNISSRLQDGLAFLATVGSTAPFVGLFGTVWGIYHALTAIGISGQASIDKVAGPVGEALIMTAFGLAVAVPAVMGYNWLIRRNKSVMEKVRAFSGDVHNVLLAGKK